MKKITYTVIFCVMILTLAGCTSDSNTENSSPIHADNYLAAVVGGEGEFIDAALIYPQNASATKEGITVTAKQAVADNHRMYILLAVTATPDMEFTYQDRFDMYNAGVTESGSTSGFEWTTVSKDKNILYMIVGVDSEEGLDKGTVSVSLWDLKKYEGNKEKVYNGNWNLKFDYEVADVTERYISDAVIKTDGLDLKFDYIDISPFGVYIDFSFADSSVNPGEDWDYDTMDVDVVLKDGTEVAIASSTGSAAYGGEREEFSYFRSGKLIAAIDPQEVSHILINGQKIDITQL